MGKGSAGEYPTTTMNTGLYGSSTTNKKGTTYNPTDFQKNLVNTSQQGISSTLSEFLNPSYKSETYLADKAQRQKQQQQAFDASVLSPLANRGLMRSSGLQAATNSFADTLANQESQAMANYKTEQANKLATLLGLYEMPYNMMTGTSGLSQGLSNAVGNYNLQNQAQLNASNSGAFGQIANTVGTIGKLAMAGPTGGASLFL
ncbi:MAG: hypothetical protein ACLSWI_05380 [Candidatus Gastranaerophilaceae bacterium]